ncbi:MAG: helix-turn-helix domain-containing protein [Candidatus Aminicenantes bacterium]|nr:helix-turn-helix domain-containing protein [Candidatus Aminicenantes bacterium]
MAKEDYRKYYETLGVDNSASAEEVKQAYLHKKKVFSAEAEMPLPLADEFTGEKKQDILDRVEEAFTKLAGLLGIEEKKQWEDDLSYISKADTLPEFELPPLPEEELSSFAGEGFSIQSEVEPRLPSLAEGQVLKAVRESLGMSLNDLWQVSEIPYGTLEQLELEDFSAFPDAGYVRWCVFTCAKHLGLDPKETADEYMKRYRGWQNSRAGEE